MLEASLIGVLVVGALAGAVVFGWRSTERSKLRRLPRFTVASLPAVTVGRIVGVARELAGTTIAPLSLRPCLFYWVQVREPDSRGNKGSEIAQGTGGVTFALEDETGTATVNPELARSVLPDDELVDPPGAKAYLHGLGVTHVPRLRYWEAIVRPGQTLAVVGFGSRDADQLTLASSPHLPLVIGPG